MVHTKEFVPSTMRGAELTLWVNSDFRVSEEKLPNPCPVCGGGVWFRDGEGKLAMTPHDMKLHSLE